MLRVGGLSKSQSLIQLKSNGFNTVDFIVTTAQQDVWGFINSRMVGNSGYSIRTEKEGKDNKSNFNYPFYMGIKSTHKLMEIAKGLINGGYTLIVYQTVSPKDAVCKGTAVIMTNSVYVEYLEGPGIVRDLEKGNPNHFRCMLSSDYPSKPATSWSKAIFELMANKVIQPEIIVEWSYYPYRVGLQSKNLILWELRPWR